MSKKIELIIFESRIDFPVRIILLNILSFRLIKPLAENFKDFFGVCFCNIREIRIRNKAIILCSFYAILQIFKPNTRCSITFNDAHENPSRTRSFTPSEENMCYSCVHN